MGCFTALTSVFVSSVGRGNWNQLPQDEQTFGYYSFKPPCRTSEKEPISVVSPIRCLGYPTDKQQPPECLSPVVQRFKTMIETDPLIQQLFIEMFAKPCKDCKIHSYHALLRQLDDIIARAPEFNMTVMAGFPIDDLLAWPMSTPSGVRAFMHEKVNLHIRNILNTWATFLKSADSARVLNDDPVRGWLGSDALALMPNFADNYVCDVAKPHYGFESWDAFFTRQFREGIRPVESPDDISVVAHACESAPYRLAHGVKLRDRFWMKHQSYSLEDMLAGDPLTPEFEGGTVYQAYLGCLNYHRWHSPISGTIKKTRRKSGTYYAQCPALGYDSAAPNKSQAYLNHVASRGMVFIEADDPALSLVCFIAVGMAECSSCEITVTGQRVKRGDELGMFHYGGSTYCLIFQPSVNLRFTAEARRAGDNASTLPVRSALAFVDNCP